MVRFEYRGLILEEIWKEIHNYEGYYEISNLGNVRSITRNIIYPDGHKQKIKGKMLTPIKTKWGYLQVKLNKNGLCKRKHIHDLVAEAFIPNPKNLEEVNHKDHNKLNNTISNLEWISHKDNMTDMRNFKKKTLNLNKNICPKCGNTKSLKASICLECWYKKHSSNIPLKEELIDLIYQYSFKTIGKMFNVSDNAVRKWCKKYDLPYKRKDINYLINNLSI